MFSARARFTRFTKFYFKWPRDTRLKRFSFAVQFEFNSIHTSYYYQRIVLFNMSHRISVLSKKCIPNTTVTCSDYFLTFLRIDRLQCPTCATSRTQRFMHGIGVLCGCGKNLGTPPCKVCGIESASGM